VPEQPGQLQRLKAVLADRYRIERELGRGGMATVYLAEDLKHHRQLAIKVLNPELTASVGADRFLREIEIAARLNHPNILMLIDSGEADGFLYYVMPYVAGESLRDRLNREPQLPIADALEITREVAAALSHAHAHDVVHRDIKPENIMLDAGRAIVTDFGIARAVTVAGGEKLTATGVAVGTPHYMSPEQATGREAIDGRSDIYALGCVLYEMLGGDPPFTGSSAQAILARHSVDPVPNLRTIRTTVPEAVAQAVERALAKVPADRFSAASAFADALTQTAGPKRWRPAGRKRWVLATFSAAALLAIGFAVGPRLRTGSDQPAPARLVLASIPVVGTDSALGLAVRTALELALTEAPSVTLVAAPTVDRTLQNMGSEAGVFLDEPTALEVAERAGAAGAVLPAIHQVGAGYQLSARLITPDGRTQAVAEARAATREDLIAGIHDLSLDLRTKLGEARGSLRASQDLSSMVTHSLEALRLYAQAVAADKAGQLAEAGRLMERAVVVDPDFAMAHFWIFRARQAANTDYLGPMERALALKDRLPPWHRFLVEAAGAQWAEREPLKALQFAEAELGTLASIEDPGIRQSRHIIITNLLGVAALMLGRPAQALEAHARIIDADLAAGSADLADQNALEASGADLVLPFVHGNHSAVLAQMGEFEESERVWRETVRRWPWLQFGEPYHAAAHGQFERAAQLVRSLADRNSPSQRPFDLELLATFEAVRGRPNASRSVFGAAVEAARQAERPDLLSRFAVRRAEVEFFAFDDAERALAIIAPVVQDSVPREGLQRRLQARAFAIVAAVCSQLPAQLVELPAAATPCTVRQRIDRLRDDLEAMERDGWWALGAGNFEQAIRIGGHARLARAGFLGWRARLPAAIAYERLGMADSARAVYELLTPPRWGRTPPDLPPALLVQVFALRGLVRLGGERGEEARRTLRGIWQDAEPEFAQTVGRRIEER
jgi:tetratricopeptide (TPR) repeat protein